MATTFQLIKTVLDELFPQIKEVHGEGAKAAVHKQIEALRGRYRNLLDPKNPTIDYRDPVVRFAYIYVYVTAHSDYVYKMISRFSPVKKLFNQKHLSMTCLGGGPGTELVGLLKYFSKTKTEVTNLLCYLCDREDAWSDSWSDINEKLTTPGLSVNTNFQTIDVSDKDTWVGKSKFLNSDLIVLSFFVSEIYRFRDQGDIPTFWKLVFDKAKKGALFVFIDNGDTRFTLYFDALTKSSGLATLESGDEELVPSYEEQTTDLGEHFKMFQDQAWPKLKAQLSYRLLQKQ